MNIEGRTFRELMGGGIICAVSKNEMFEWLTEQNGLQIMTEFIRPMDYKIAVTNGEKSFYLAALDGSEEAINIMRSQAKPLHDETMRVQCFLELMMKIDSTAGPLSMGDFICASKISEAIQDAPSLREELLKTASDLAVKGTTDLLKISSILRKMEDMGYLHMTHKAREEYEVTGKIQFFFDILEHYSARIGSVQDAVDQAAVDQFDTEVHQRSLI